jgi:hypothetical protein
MTQVSTALMAYLSPVSITTAANLPPVLLVLLIPVANELEEKKYLYVNSTTQKCTSKIFKTFLFEGFFQFFCVNGTGGAP